jgi:uncharacterized protein
MLKKIPLILLLFLLVSGCSRTRKEYYPSGALKSEISMKNGEYSGRSVYYYENGKPMMSCSYIHNKLDGELYRYFQSGYHRELQTYRDGILHGVSRIWDRNSHLIRVMNFTMGKPDGAFQEWYGNRILKVDGHYKNGNFDGIWLYYDLNENVTGEGIFAEGSGVQKAYWENGNIRNITHYKNNVKEGEEVFYDQNGKILKTISYHNGLPSSVSETGKNN